MNVTPIGLSGPLLAAEAARKFYGVTAGRLTAAPLLFNRTPIALSPHAAAAYERSGYSGARISELLEGLRPRPVYALRSAPGTVGYLFGPPGATDGSPANSLWFRAALTRDDLAYQTQISPALAAQRSGPPLSQLEWRHGRWVTVVPGAEVVKGRVPAAVAELWRQRKLLGGVAMLAYDAQSSVRSVIAVPSSGILGSGLYKDYYKVGTPAWYFSLGYSGRSGVLGSANNGALQYFVHDGKELPCMMGDVNSSITSSSQHTYAGFQPMAWRLPEPFVAPSVDLATLQGAVDWMAGSVSAVSAGSFFPFPLSSTLIGYVWGLPSRPDVIVWEGTPDQIDGKDVIRISRAYGDLNTDDYKALYPVASLPTEQQAEMQAKMDDLPPHVKFRVGVFPAGLSYGTLKYDETKLAAGIRKAGSVLDDLLFDHLDESKPPIGYGSLGAQSLRRIDKRQHVAVAIAISGDSGDLVSLATVTFARVEGVVTATQGGFEIDAGEAMIAIRSGAPSSFTAPVTQDEAAAEFFLLPSWADVMSFEEEEQSVDYLVDENTISNELLFDLADDDERARVLPLLLGFERNDFAVTVGSVLLGALPHERVVP